MKNIKFAIQTLALVGLFFAFSAIADAQATRTWVSGVGDDVNPCSRTAPCKTFAGAISKTATNGEINCLDPAGYGTITITKSITIDCEDTQGSILASLTNGVTLNGAGISVRLRGISINGAGNGLNGIRVVGSSARLVLEEVVIDNFTTHGISIENNSGTFRLIMKDTTIRNNGTHGINTFLTGGALASISITDSLIASNNNGLNQGVSVTSTIQNSTFTNNTTGILVSGSQSAIFNSTISHNTTGISVSGGGTVRIGENLIASNTTGVSGANIFSFGNNFIDGNNTNGTVTGAASVQ